MSHIFISYSHKDTTYAHGLADHLKSMGIEVWIDERLDYGSQWPYEIQTQLDSCDAFLLIMTPRSFASDWVQSELQRAKRKLKPIFPLLLEGEPWLSVESTQYYNVRGGTFPDAKFYAAIRRVMSNNQTASTLNFPKKAVQSTPVGSSMPKSRTGIIFAVFGILVVISLACAGAIVGMRFLLPAFQPSPTSVTATHDAIPISQTTPTSEPTMTWTPILPTDTSFPPTTTATVTPIPTNTLTFTPTITPTQPIPQEEYVDSSTVDQDMHVCPAGFAIAGVRVDRNQFLCRRVMRFGEEKFVVTVIDSGTALTARADMHACPVGMYMRGLRVDRNDLLCSYDGRKNPPAEWQREFENRVDDPGSVGYDMHICPASAVNITYLTGIRVDQNRFLCAIHQP